MTLTNQTRPRGRSLRNLFRSMAAFAGSGALLASSCSQDDIQAVVAGLEAAASTLDGFTSRPDEDITFGEWVLSELED